LCQQQVPLVYHLYNSSTDQESTARSNQVSRSSSRHATAPDLPRQSTSYSMPDLSGRTSPNPTRFNQKQHASKVSRSSSFRSSNHRQDNIVCLPAMTYPPYVCPRALSNPWPKWNDCRRTYRIRRRCSIKSITMSPTVSSVKNFY